MKAWAVQPSDYNMTPEPAWLTAAKTQILPELWVVVWRNGMWAGPYTRDKAIGIALEAHLFDE